MREKIGLHDTMQETIVKMSEGNPGALRVLMEIFMRGGINIFKILSLDDMNIRGWQIWVGYKDYCKCDLDEFLECIQNRDPEMVDTINREAIKLNSPLRAVTRGASFNR